MNDCKMVAKEECKDIEREECNDVPREECKQVPREVCVDIDVPYTDYETKEECKTLQVSYLK